MGLELAADEAASNIIKHSYDTSEGKIQVSGFVDDNTAKLELIDNGTPFNPTEFDLPAIDQMNAGKNLGGYGLLLMRHFTDEIHYSYSPAGQNRLTLVLRI